MMRRNFDNVMNMNVVNGAIDVDGRYTKAIDDIARNDFGKTLDLNGVRELAQNLIEKHTGKKVIIPQADSRFYMGMSLCPNAQEKQLYNYAFNSGYTLRINRLTKFNTEKGTDGMQIADGILYGNSISGIAFITGDGDFQPLFETIRANGVPIILFTTDYGKTYCSKRLKSLATVVVDLLSLINDPRIFKPLYQSFSGFRTNNIQNVNGYNGKFPGNRGFNQSNRSYNQSRPVYNAQRNYNQGRSAITVTNCRYGSFTSLVVKAVKNVMTRNSRPGKTAAFAYQNEVISEISRLGRHVNGSLETFLRNKPEIFMTGKYGVKPTVSLR